MSDAEIVRAYVRVCQELVRWQLANRKLDARADHAWHDAHSDDQFGRIAARLRAARDAYDARKEI